MKKLVIVLSLIMLKVSVQAQQNFKTLDSALTILANEEQFHGQVLIAENGEIEFLKSYGSTAKGNPFNLETTIGVESVAKAITALSIMMLHEQGKLNINDPLSKYFPSLNFYEGVQLKHILNHTSGLPRFFELVFSNWPHDKFLTLNDMVSLIDEHKPNVQSRPGEYESYNQTAYMLLPGVVETVTGTSFTEFVEENIFKPAKMNRTYFSVRLPNFKDQIGKANLDNLFAFMVGDGGIQSNAEDLFRLDQAISSAKLISPLVMSQSYRPAKLGNGEEGRYGYGGSLVVKEVGQRQFQHIGQGATSNAVFTRFIDSNNVLVVLHDQSVQYASAVYTLVKNIWEGQPFQLPQKRNIHKISQELIAKYVGDYGDNGFMHLTTEDGKIYIQPDGNPSRVEIIPSSDTTFYFADQDMNWEIYLDEKGDVIGFGPAGEKQFMMLRYEK